MKNFIGEDDGCTYCDFYPYAVSDHVCQRGKHMNYKKCGWYSDLEAQQNTKETGFTSYNKPSAKCPRCHDVTMVAGKFDTGWEVVPCPECQVLDTSHVG